MAQKKVILKDGQDELMPKTMASMVFTESGQTVENVLKNTGGGGGTGDSGIADITSIYSKMNIQNGGILGSDDLATLKGYMEAGKVLKMAMDGATLTFSYNTSGTLITLSSSPMVSPSMYGAMIVISLLIDSETGEYVGVTDEDSGQLVQQMIPSSANATQLCTMNGYTKPSSYSEISPNDSINSAIGKLEAGIGSGGSGGGDDTYYLPSTVYDLEAGATKDEIVAAFGGKEKILEFLNEAAINGRKIYIKKAQEATNVGESKSTPVSFKNVSLGFANFGITFKKRTSFTDSSMYYSAPESTVMIGISISPSSGNVNGATINIIYDMGYSLDISVGNLTSSSDTDSISSAVGGENGLKEIIQAVKGGNRLVIRDSSGYNVDLCAIYSVIEESGNMTFGLSGIGYGMFGGFGGIMYINYTKSSNTFSCEVVPISMGS